MARAAQELKTIDDIVAAFTDFHELEDRQNDIPDYYTLNIGYGTAYVDGVATFASHGEAKGKALEYLVRYQDRLNAIPIKKSDSKAYKQFVQTMITMNIDQLVELRDKLLDEGEITIEEGYY